MGASAYTADLIKAAATHGTAYQAPADIYLAFVTTVPDMDDPGTEPTDSGYARVAMVQPTIWSDNGEGSLLTNADILQAAACASVPWSWIAVSAFDAATDGNFLWYELMPTPVSIVVGQQALLL